MRQAVLTGLLLAGAVLLHAAEWWVPLVPLGLRVLWDGWGFFRSQVVPLLRDD
ncbi:MAG TPA: hypothetical protein VFS33_02725 [Gemmatimonadales bacterium]|nr:hypothetical protein [Gemmatimonadales bacterium]